MLKVSTFFRYINRREKFYMIIGTISAVFTGILLPGMAILIGLITNTYDPDNTPEDVFHQMEKLAGIITLVGAITWFFGYVYWGFWQHLAENISFDLRSRYLRAILRQEVAFFELTNVEQLPAQIGEYFFVITESIGEKLSNIIFSLSSVIAGIAIAFYMGADYTAICIAFFPLILCVSAIFGARVKKAT